MNNTLKFAVRATVAAAALSTGTIAFAAAAIDANIELDNTSREGTAVAAADKGLSQSGRLELNVANKAGADLFVAGRATFLAKKDGNVGTDDMWIQLGSSSVDVKLGRFEAADLFPLAGDTLVNHAGTVYGTNLLRGRKASDVFHAATTFRTGNGFAFELGVIQTTTNTLLATNVRGVRPEYNSGNKINGFGLTTSYNFGSFKLTGNYAQGKQDAIVDESQNAYGITVASGGLSVGAIVAKNDATGGNTRVQTGYVSYSMPLLGVKGATITPAVSLSKAQNSVANTNVEETAFRVRLHYDF
jgi:hypothetical protein